MSWSYVNLGDLFTIQKGKKHNICDTLSSDSCRFLQIDDLRNDNNIKYTSDKKGVLAEKADVIIAWDGANAGTVGYKKAGFIGSTLALLRFNTEVVHTDFLFFFLKSKYQELRDNCTGATIPHINKNHLISLKIPLPPLEIQKQIAAVLSKADSLRQDCAQMSQELNTLAQAVFMDMFGDDLNKLTKNLNDCAHVVSGACKGQKFNGKPTIIAPYMRVANVQDGYLNLSEIKEIEIKETDFEKYLLQEGDVLLTEGGDHDKLGRGAVWQGELENCVHQNHVFRVRLNREKYLPSWFASYLQTKVAKQYFLKCAKKTTNLASINITQLKNLPLPDITLQKQKTFDLILQSIKVQLSNNDDLINEHELNFQSLTQKAFSGQLELTPSEV